MQVIVAAIRHSVVVSLYQAHKTAASGIRLWCRSDRYFHGGAIIFREKWSGRTDIPEILVPRTNFSAGPKFPWQFVSKARRSEVKFEKVRQKFAS